ncbi:succinyl-CoA synthetase subunit alpha [Archaeoglobales archaeon]|nr:MAG: succinyl-CoA synthetase subunit alpha [Archaeoglobales archaeon]
MPAKSKIIDSYTYYLNTDLSKYIGYWIAIVDDEIASYGKNAKEVYEEAKKKYPSKKPLLAKIPKERTLIF